MTDALERSQKEADASVDAEEVAHMRNAVEEWKSQSEHSQEELTRTKKENSLVRAQNGSYAQEIGKMLGLTRERIRQIEKKAITKLRGIDGIGYLRELLV